jgi:small nuclear ribonucleoprotein (snRNP)-like protein
MIFFFPVLSRAQEVNVVLKNSKVIVGRMIEEQSRYILIDTELGELKINRSNIDNITYNPFIKLNPSPETASSGETAQNGNEYIINDPVVVYLKNGTVVSGILLAKSLSMIMLQTEEGNLTIPKKDLGKIEYISREFEERGEVVIVHLDTGVQLKGNIYFEDTGNLTLDTEVGRLTLSKNKVRMIEYTGKNGPSDITLADQYANISMRRRNIPPRVDVFDLGYSSKYNANYGPGFGIGYSSHFSVSQEDGYNVSAVGGVSVNYFQLNEDNILKENTALSANLKGGALITTVSAGGQINVYPQATDAYDVLLSPLLEAHIVNRKLDQKYPSFPQFDKDESENEVKFGVGLKFGLEFSRYKIGLSYHHHFILGDSDFSRFLISYKNVLF